MSKDFTYTVAKQKDSVVKVEVVASAQTYARHKDLAFSRLSDKVKIPGFRPGKAPKQQVEERLGSDLFNETIKSLLTNTAADIVDGEKLNPVTTLEYDVTKASDAGVEFSFTFTEYPQVKLGDLQKIKMEVAEVKVTDPEVDDVVKNLFQKKTVAELPEITEEEIAKIGIPAVKDMASLRKEVTNRLTIMKQEQAHGDALENVIKEAVKISEIPVPAALKEQAVTRLVDDFMAKIEKLNLDVDEFLKAQNKDREKLSKEKEVEAQEQIERELLLTEVVRHYELMPTADDIEAEIAAISEPETRERYANYEGRRYIMSVLIQRRALEKLHEITHAHAHQTPAQKKETKPAKKSKLK